jgi:hypothetical protein
MRFLLFLFALSAGLFAQINRTCTTCSRQTLDSANLSINPVRVNQVGYRADDPHKQAYCANPASMTFSIINADNGVVAYTGTLAELGDYPALEGKIQIRASTNATTDLYSLSNTTKNAEHLYRAAFGNFSQTGVFRIAVGRDTSAAFTIRSSLYNDVSETALKFFGVNRCGDTKSWIHAACHLQDGSALGASYAGRLAGGWHDCGDHGKYASTQAYTALVLSLCYALWPEKAEDRFGASYHDSLPGQNDGIPDILFEAKIGVDFIVNLYTVSKELGMIDAGDMYHSVGDFSDHSYWDLPENQDAQPTAKGGPPRALHKGIGSNVAGSFAAALALFSWGWEPYDTVYAQRCRAAAIEIYDKIVMKKLGSPTKNIPGYTGGGMTFDDEAMAALALWFVTKEERFGYDLYRNKNLRVNNNVVYDGNFPAGHMGREPFHHGGWTTDHEQINAYVLYAFAALIVPDTATALMYGLEPLVRDSLRIDIKECLKQSIRIGSNGSNKSTYPGINVDYPYHGVFTSVDWGFNRYNLGMVDELFMYWNLTKENGYYEVGMDNLNYTLGMNPWDISFLMGAGSKNLNHPHNRAANPDGYNGTGVPYQYRAPIGALMGGQSPGSPLIDDWERYTATETCIDFSSTLIFPAMLLADRVHNDRTGPIITSGVSVSRKGTDTITITWKSDEPADAVIQFAHAPGAGVIRTVRCAALSGSQSIPVDGLSSDTVFYFRIISMDRWRNVSIDDNNGQWYGTDVSTARTPRLSGGVAHSDDVWNLTLYTVHGKAIKTMQVSPAYSRDLLAKRIPAGVYVVRMCPTGKVENPQIITKRVVVPARR